MVEITGHGNINVLNISGIYPQKDDSKPLDIQCLPDDYVDMVIESGSLKKGDHINILLYICYAAYQGDQKSFARQFAEKFMAKGISTHIVASTEAVQRIGGYSGISDVENEVVRFRANKESIRFIEGKFNNTVTESSPNVDVFITQKGIITDHSDALKLYKQFKNRPQNKFLQ